GSALGTVLSVSSVLILYSIYVWKHFPIIRLSKADFRYRKDILSSQLKIAVPMSIQFSVLSISMMVIQGTCNTFGPEVIAAFTAALRIEQLATQPLLALGMAMATFAAQNFGAKKLSRIRQGARLATTAAFLISVAASLLVFYVGRDMIAVFLNEQNDFIVETGKMYLSISTMFYFFLGLIFVYRNVLQGMGKAVLPLVASIVELLLRSFAAVYLAALMGYKGIFYASPIAWVGASSVVIIGYVIIIRRFSFANQTHKKRLS
ncbi:MAG: MATE family efflux transporter, partial [Alphaproteobacteria bacterium]|nr:MATE family efflux transporter [Alphaproteobacteria bacterium]